MARLPVLGTLLVALLLAGCTGADPAGDADADPGVGGADDAAVERVDYVALGDSYSAGPLVTTVRSDPSECGRSTDNYPAFLADWLDVASYRDVTCSGAETRDLTRRQDVFGVRRVPPQLDALSRGTDLVTVGLGGNDFDIFSTLSGCAGSAPGTPCRADFTALERDAARVEARLREGLEQVARRAPDADVVVVGYPRVLPDRGTCPALGLDVATADATRRVQQRLEESVEAAAAAAGATYVDLWAASRGHDVCAGAEAWVNGRRLRVGEAAPFHPFLAGMRAAARVVYEEVTGEAAPTEDASGQYAAPDPAAVRANRVTR